VGLRHPERRRTAKTGGWQEHKIRQGDGKGGWVTWPAHRQVLKHPDANFTMPFGLVRMDNGEIALLCSREKEQPKGGKTFEPIIAFSKDTEPHGRTSASFPERKAARSTWSGSAAPPKRMPPSRRVEFAPLSGM